MSFIPAAQAPQIPALVTPTARTATVAPGAALTRSPSAPTASTPDASQNQLDLSPAAQGQAQAAVEFPESDSQPAPSLDAIRNSTPEQSVSMKEGHFGENVADIQKIFMGLGLLIANAPSKSYTPLVMQAVQTYQNLNGLPPTGEVDRKTLNQAERDTAARRESEAIQNEAQARPGQATAVPVLPQTQFPPRPTAGPEAPKT